MPRLREVVPQACEQRACVRHVVKDCGHDASPALALARFIGVQPPLEIVCFRLGKRGLEPRRHVGLSQPRSESRARCGIRGGDRRIGIEQRPHRVEQHRADRSSHWRVTVELESV